jgi:hypothetical protein
MRNESMRDEVCDMYANYFPRLIKIREAKKYIEELIQIYIETGSLALLCWCYPKRCHALTIAKYIRKEVRVRRLALK